MSLSVIYEVTHDSLWLISKQDYGSPCEMSMQVNMPGIVQLHFEWSKTSEPCKGFYDGLEALKRFLSILRVLIFDSNVDRAIPSLAAAPDGPKTRPRDSVRAASIACFSSAVTLCLSSGWLVGDVRNGWCESQFSST